MAVLVVAERGIEKGQRSSHEVQLHVKGVGCGSRRFVVFSYWGATTKGRQLTRGIYSVVVKSKCPKILNLGFLKG
jgi:hypothetical protein